MFINKYKNIINIYTKINNNNRIVRCFTNNNSLFYNNTTTPSSPPISPLINNSNGNSNIQEINQLYKSLKYKINNKNIGQYSNQIISLQRSLLKYGIQEINKLSYSERLNIVSLFWDSYRLSINGSKLEKKLNKVDYDEIWELMNIDDKLLKSGSVNLLDYIKIQFDLSLDCLEFRSRLVNSIQRLVKELKKRKENQQWYNELVANERYSQLFEVSFKFSLKMGLWKESIYIRDNFINEVKWLDKVNSNGRDRDLNGSFEDYDYELIYRTISTLYTSINNSKEERIEEPPLSLNQDLEYSGFYILNYLDSVKFSKSALNLYDSNGIQINNVSTTQLEHLLPVLNKLNIGEEYNYYLNPRGILIEGRLVKFIYDLYSKSKVIYCGIINQDFSKCHLIGLEDSDSGDAVNLDLNLSLSKNQDTLNLEGDNTLVTKFSDGKFLIQQYHISDLIFKKE